MTLENEKRHYRTEPYTACEHPERPAGPTTYLHDAACLACLVWMDAQAAREAAGRERPIRWLFRPAMARRFVVSSAETAHLIHHAADLLARLDGPDDYVRDVCPVAGQWDEVPA